MGFLPSVVDTVCSPFSGADFPEQITCGLDKNGALELALDLDVPETGSPVVEVDLAVTMNLCPSSASDPISIVPSGSLAVFGLDAVDIEGPNIIKDLATAAKSSELAISKEFPSSLVVFATAAPKLIFTPTLTSKSLEVDVAVDACIAFSGTASTAAAAVNSWYDDNVHDREFCSADLVGILADLVKELEKTGLLSLRNALSSAGVAVDDMITELEALETALDDGISVGKYEFTIPDICDEASTSAFAAQADALVDDSSAIRYAPALAAVVAALTVLF